MINLLYIFLAIALFKLISNTIKYIQCKGLCDLYFKWLLRDPKAPIAEYTSQVVKLLKDAGVEDGFLPFVQPAGYGQLATGTTSVFANFPNRREDMATMTVKMFDQAKGVYRSRVWEAINPIYWIETIIYLPREMLKYLGVSSDNVGAKFLQVVYWIGGGITGVAFVWYRPDLKNFVDELVKRVFP